MPFFLPIPKPFFSGSVFLMQKDALREALQAEKELLERERESESQEEHPPCKGLLIQENLPFREGTWKLRLGLPFPFQPPDWFRIGALLRCEPSGSPGTLMSISPRFCEVLLHDSEPLAEDLPCTLLHRSSEKTYAIPLHILETLLAEKNPSLEKKILRFWNQKEEPKPDEFTLFFGPPGTGKTFQLLELASDAYQRGKKVLFLAPNHFTVDLFTEKLAERSIPVLRLGFSPKISTDVEKHTYERKKENHPHFRLIEEWRKEWKELERNSSKWKRNFGTEEREERARARAEIQELKKQIRSSFAILEKEILESSQVITSTFVPAWELFQDKEFDLVLVDEATQAWEANCYLAMLLGKRTVFAGDPKQLPPFFRTKQKSEPSFFEKALLHFPESQILVLREQRRMPEILMHFPNTEFYESQLTTKVQSVFEPWGEFQSPLIWLDTAGSDAEEERFQESFRNPQEVNILVKIFQCEDCPEDWRVITPYSAQKQLLQERLSELDPFWFQTIDSFQGRESDWIFLSLVRSNSLGEVGFLQEPRRLNVALTRARKGLVVVGDSSTLTQNPLYLRLYEENRQSGQILSVFEFPWEDF